MNFYARDRNKIIFADEVSSSSFNIVPIPHTTNFAVDFDNCAVRDLRDELRSVPRFA
jgi:hypothetical protein